MNSLTFPVGFKPMLAATLTDAKDAHKLKYPAYVSPKLDGIRCVTNSLGTPITRTGNVLMNTAIRTEFEKYKIPFLDGELIWGDPVDPTTFNLTSGLVRSRDKPFDEITYYIFDRIVNPVTGQADGFEERFMHNLPELPTDSKIKFVILDQRKVYDEDGVTGWEEAWYEKKFEGIIIRSNFEKFTNMGALP